MEEMNFDYLTDKYSRRALLIFCIILVLFMILIVQDSRDCTASPLTYFVKHVQSNIEDPLLMCEVVGFPEQHFYFDENGAYENNPRINLQDLFNN